jgi:hypothetical protein
MSARAERIKVPTAMLETHLQGQCTLMRFAPLPSAR